MSEEKKGRGGSRQGAGRKPKWQEETDTIAFRWPRSFVAKLRQIKNVNEKAYKALQALK